MSQLNNKNYYEILEIEKNATKKDIKKAYFQASKKYHPDINKSPTAEEDFKIVYEAYETLYDDQRRKEYDKFIKKGFTDNSSYKQKTNFYHFSPTWIEDYMNAIKDISLLKKHLEGLTDDEIFLSFDYFWRSFWSGSNSGQKTIMLKISSVIFITFIESLKIDWYMNLFDKEEFENANDLYKKAIVKLVSDIDLNSNAGISIYNYIADIINDDNFFDVPYSCILGYKNPNETHKLFKLIEFIWEKYKDHPNDESQSGKKIPHKKKSGFNITISGAIFIVILIIIVITST